MQHDLVPQLTWHRAGGALTAVYTYGPVDGREIIAVHGFRGTHHGLEPMLIELARRGYRVLAPDLPATGESHELKTRHDAAGYGAWLTELARARPVPPILLGHSFGSTIAAAAISQGAPHEASILVNPILEHPLYGQSRVTIALTKSYYGLARRLPKAVATRLLASRLVAAVTGTILTTTTDALMRRQIREQHRELVSRFSSRTAVCESFDAATSSNVSDYEAAFTRPTLILTGDIDPLSAVRAAIETHIPHTITSVFARQGHLIPLERPAEAAERIDRWHGTVVDAGARGSIYDADDFARAFDSTRAA